MKHVLSTVAALAALAALATACGNHNECANCAAPDDAAAAGDDADDGLLPDGSPHSDAAVTPVDAATPDAPYMPSDPFTIDTCTAMTFADLVTRFSPGSTSASVGAFKLTSRSRASCNEITGCSPWTAPSPVRLQQIFARGGYPKGATHAMPATGPATLVLDTNAPAKIQMELVAPEPGNASLTIRFRCEGVPQNGAATSLDCSAIVEFPGDYPSLLWFVDTYAGQPLFDNTTMVSWRGKICTDGRYQLVTKLATDLGTLVTGMNNKNQLAIYGQL